MLSAVLWMLLLSAATVLAAALLVLSTPLELWMSVRTHPSWRLEVATRLLGGISPPIVLHKSERRDGKRAAGPGRERRPAASGRRKSAFSRAVKAVPRLLADLLRLTRLKHIRLDADIGLPDPADTGRLYGLLAALRHWHPSRSTVSIEVRPDFSGPCASGELEVAVSFVPVTFVPPGLRFAWRLLRTP